MADDREKQAEHQFLVVAVWPNGHGERSMEDASTVNAQVQHYRAQGAEVYVTYLGRHHGRLPVTIADGGPYAIADRPEQENDSGEHPAGDSRGAAAEASGGDSVPQGGPIFQAP